MHRSGAPPTCYKRKERQWKGLMDVVCCHFVMSQLSGCGMLSFFHHNTAMDVVCYHFVMSQPNGYHFFMITSKGLKSSRDSASPGSSPCWHERCCQIYVARSQRPSIPSLSVSCTHCHTASLSASHAVVRLAGPRASQSKMPNRGNGFANRNPLPGTLRTDRDSKGYRNRHGVGVHARGHGVATIFLSKQLGVLSQAAIRQQGCTAQHIAHDVLNRARYPFFRNRYSSTCSRASAGELARAAKRLTLAASSRPRDPMYGFAHGPPRDSAYPQMCTSHSTHTHENIRTLKLAPTRSDAPTQVCTKK